MEPATAEATASSSSNNVTATAAASASEDNASSATSASPSSANTTATTDATNVAGGEAASASAVAGTPTSSPQAQAGGGGATVVVTSSPEAANLSTATVAVAASSTALIKQARSAPALLAGWTWVNPGQQLLSVADVRPDCAPTALPPHLGTIFAQLATTAPRCTQPDILFALIYAVALECGFCSSQHCQQQSAAAAASAPDQQQLQPQPQPSSSCWFSFSAQLVRQCAGSYPPQCYDHGDNFYQCPLRLAGNWPQAAATDCRLIARDIGGTLCVSLNTLSAAGPTQLGGAVRLAVSEYVVRQQLQLGVAKCVKNLDQLAAVLRARLFGPVREGLLLAMGLPAPNLLGMPEEVRRTVYRQMGLADLQRWSQVCRLAREEVIGFVPVKYPRVMGLPR